MHNLRKHRKRKGISQQQIADYLCMDVSNYNRREKGKLQIRPNEWLKLTEILEVELDDIYEPDPIFQLDYKDYSVGLKKGKFKIFAIPKTLLDSQHKYIELLESKIKELKSELEKFR